MHTLVVLLTIMQSTVGIPADRRLPPRPPNPACAQGQYARREDRPARARISTAAGLIHYVLAYDTLVV